MASPLRPEHEPEPETPGRPRRHRRQRYYADDATRWVLVLYGLVQACVTSLIVFDVIDASSKLPAAVTAVALVLYAGVNELYVRPYHRREMDDS